MLISWSRGWSVQVQKCTFFLPKWVHTMHRAPHSPPGYQFPEKCQWFRYTIKYLAFKWGRRGFGLGEWFIGTVWGDFGVGTTIWNLANIILIGFFMQPRHSVTFLVAGKPGTWTTCSMYHLLHHLTAWITTCLMYHHLCHLTVWIQSSIATPPHLLSAPLPTRAHGAHPWTEQHALQAHI